MAIKATTPGLGSGLGTMPVTGMPAGGPILESSKSAVSWGAVFGGATVATAVTVMLTALGSGIGLSAVSPFSHDSNPSPTGFTAIAAIWLIIVQWVSSGLGGYVTGRMRTKWAEVHTHEVFFRDTANGFIMWAVASLLVVGALASAVGNLADHGAHAATEVAANTDGRQSYMVDVLFRPGQAGVGQTDADARARAEAGRLLMANANGAIAQEDRAYLTQLVTAHAGVPAAEADRRVNELVSARDAAATQAKQAANVVRKATASFMFFSFVSMLIGAFIACTAAALGGRERDPA